MPLSLSAHDTRAAISSHAVGQLFTLLHRPVRTYSLHYLPPSNNRGPDSSWAYDCGKFLVRSTGFETHQCKRQC
ncbi:BgTH12-01705 [Blumeria graminis f. sp. triticale]|uniref:Bgt-20749 n=3 Tax=Blumeria graminis TaxID=34373 RepID=A0A381LAC8_BLUGR|nr:BgTH12-01705 [Blumeria graminis f. sp. triticale]VDB83948.1 Bgt-20749 [Blumeria graminis f. sp. tritici]